MAEKKAEKSELVVKVPLAVIRTKSGPMTHLYQGADVARDAFDADHLQQLEDEGAIGAPDDSSK